MLDELLSTPRLLEIDRAEVAASPDRVWQLLRHGELAKSPLLRALFAVRTLPDRIRGHAVNTTLCIDDLQSSAAHPGFQILAERAPREIAVGAIGKVWQPEIPFVHVADARAFAAFNQPGFVRVAWALRVLPLGDHDARVEVEVRVDATDDESWRKFRLYFAVIGPASHFIRREVLSGLARELGTPESKENERSLPGDELLGEASTQLTHGITIAATPEAIWPWLLQMGCGRGGFYSIDVLDNGGARSARELHPEWLALEVGQTVPATPDAEGGFEVLRVQPPQVLVLGGLWDAETQRQLPFAAGRPEHYWHVTWAFALEPLDERTTRLHVRARAEFSKDGKLHALWIRPVHRLMQSSMLRHLAQRAEGTLPRDDVRDVLEGIGGAAKMVGALLTPFLRQSRTHWGLDEEVAARSYPGDELVAEPRWGWTHGIEIEAPAAAVWPWVAQIGADRGGFYSYQWLENLAGCDLVNAEVVHPEWEVKRGQVLKLHPAPEAPHLLVTDVQPAQYFVGSGPADRDAQARGEPWVEVSWLFYVEPLAVNRCRFISRYRAASSDHLATRLSFGPTLLEPVGFAMDRRMLLGIKERVERRLTNASNT